MRKLLIAAVISLLSGCALVDAYLMTHYDPNEYQLITDIRADAQQYKAQCANEEASKLNATKLAVSTQRFVLFSEHVPRNENMIAASKQLNDMSKGLVDQYAKPAKVSAMFCKIKFENIETSADKMQKVIAGRPR